MRRNAQGRPLDTIICTGEDSLVLLAILNATGIGIDGVLTKPLSVNNTAKQVTTRIAQPLQGSSRVDSKAFSCVLGVRFIDYPY
jgi:hypothetical protein